MDDDFSAALNKVLTRITESQLPETEKAEAVAELNMGMHHLVWPIVVSHVPEYLLSDAVKRSKAGQFTAEDYVELIESAIGNPATPKELHDELLAALKEVDALLDARLPKTTPVPKA